jgi:hypothetical protein
LANNGRERISFSVAIAAIVVDIVTVVIVVAAAAVVVVVDDAIADIFGHDGMMSCFYVFSNWYCVD